MCRAWEPGSGRRTPSPSCNASDRSALEREGFFAVVCDGMGGMDSGNEASEAAVEAFLQLFSLPAGGGGHPPAAAGGHPGGQRRHLPEVPGPQRHHGGGGADPGRRTPLDQRGGQRDLSQAGGVRVPAEPGADLPQRSLPAGAPAGAHPKGAGGGRRGRPPAHRLRRHRLPGQVDQSLRPWSSGRGRDPAVLRRHQRRAVPGGAAGGHVSPSGRGLPPAGDHGTGKGPAGPGQLHGRHDRLEI